MKDADICGVRTPERRTLDERAVCGGAYRAHRRLHCADRTVRGGDRAVVEAGPVKKMQKIEVKCETCAREVTGNSEAK